MLKSFSPFTKTFCFHYRHYYLSSRNNLYSNCIYLKCLFRLFLLRKILPVVQSPLSALICSKYSLLFDMRISFQTIKKSWLYFCSHHHFFFFQLKKPKLFLEGGNVALSIRLKVNIVKESLKQLTKLDKKKKA